MNFNYELTNKIKNFIKDSVLKEISIGCSNTQVFQIIKKDKTYYLKMGKLGILTKEYEKLKWLDGKLKVPKILLYDKNDKVEFLITESLKGQMICNNYFEKNPDKGIKIIKEAFESLYKINIDNCPFDASLNYQLKIVENNVKNNLIDDKDIDKEILKKYKSKENILKYLKDNKFSEELVFCHGDPSLPNIFSYYNKFSGFIDVGDCGYSDKWFDLAICEKSIIRNYGKEYVDDFYKSLGIKRDNKKADYYLLMLQLY